MTRSLEIARTRAQLERFGWPRLQMSVIVLATGAAGLLASYLLLRLAGIESMLVRYPLAILAAYAVFLVLMWLWTRVRGDVDPTGDLLDGGAGGGSPAPRGSGDWIGGGGQSGGAGSSSSWTSAFESTSGGSSDASVLDAVDGEAAVPILGVLGLIAVAVAALVAAAWVVWSAPVLMAELLVDAAIAGGLYRRMRRADAEGFWWLCLRHTFWPLFGVIAFFVVLSAIASLVAPEATTLMDMVRAL